MLFEGAFEEIGADFADHLTGKIIVFHKGSPPVTRRFQALSGIVDPDEFFGRLGMVVSGAGRG